MTITLGLWQIVGLILLTQIVVGTSSRLVTLIAMVAIRRWYGPDQSPISPNEQSLLRSAWSESGEFGTPTTEEEWKELLGRQPVVDMSGGQDIMSQYKSHMKAYAHVPGSTGFSPTGVSYSPEDVESLGHQSKKRKRKLRPVWLGGQHPHV